MNLEQKKARLIGILIIIFACSVGYNGIYKHNLSKVGSIKLQIEEQKKKNDALGMIGLLDKKLKAYQSRSFPSAEVTQLLDSVLELAKQVGIEIETFNPLPAIYKEQFIEFPIKIPVRCEYHTLGRFLSLIESNQEFIWVKGIKITKPTVTDPREKRTPRMDLTISGLYLKK